MLLGCMVIAFGCANAFADVTQGKTDVWLEASGNSGIPVKVLHGIALVESGKKWSDGTFRPWPWTLNSPARGAQFFNSYQAAEKGLNELLQQGVTNVDIGMMQINCGYHCARVKKPSDLLDPKVNIRVASKILSEVHSIRGDVASAVGAYHAGLHPSREKRSLWYQNAVAQRVRNLAQDKS